MLAYAKKFYLCKEHDAALVQSARKKLHKNEPNSLIMKKSKITVACLALSGSLMLSSCIGSFGLWNNLKGWNQGIGNKFVNEVVFLAFHIIPVYEVAYLADILVLNSIEFWSDSNPMAEVGTEKVVKGEEGEYLVRTNEDGYTIIKKGEEDKPLTLVYNKEKHSWNAVAEGKTFELVVMNEDGTVSYKQADGTYKTVSADIMKSLSKKAS